MSKYNIDKRTKKMIYIITLAAACAVMALCAYFVGRPLLRHLEDPEQFKLWIEGFGIYSKLVFVLLVILQVLMAVIPGEPFEIMAGYAFGVIEGTVLCLIGITIGSLIIFQIVRKLGSDFVEIFFKKETIDRLSFIRDPKKLNVITFLIFSIPGTPKDLLTYVMGLTPMKTGTWAVICILARIPSVLSSAYAGHLLGQENYVSSGIVFGITAIVSLIGIVIYNKYSDKENIAKSREV